MPTSVQAHKGVPMFIFHRPIAAPLAALATVLLLVLLDTLFNVSAIF
jgi:hypothetical protein